MKRILSLLLIICCFVLHSTAQAPTLTSANTTPRVGETFQNQYAQTAGVDNKSGGANQTWDYSTL
ncbi:MAG: hypothetical protein ABJA35_12615, partial [Parafilimonas sp.]